jgi:hypothetical protein
MRPAQVASKTLLFCEQKRSKKNFNFFDVTPAGITQARRGAKVFWFFFSKKNIFLSDCSAQ